VGDLIGMCLELYEETAGYPAIKEHVLTQYQSVTDKIAINIARHSLIKKMKLTADLYPFIIYHFRPITPISPIVSPYFSRTIFAPFSSSFYPFCQLSHFR